MAAKDNKKRGEAPESTRWSNEVYGILWITFGLLLLLSLVKYSPADLPKWWPLRVESGRPEVRGENLIGPVGGILGFIQILLFGGAGYLASVGCIWFGVVKLAYDSRRRGCTRRITFLNHGRSIVISTARVASSAMGWADLSSSASSAGQAR
jgi:DNA segregation ATPase FtsK/SpoIIIE, S-DNA-T family